MDLDSFRSSPSGSLVRIYGTDPRFGPWEHAAYVPNALPDQTPPLSTRTNNAVAKARAALAALDSSAAQLPNPGLLRRPTLRREAQSTSALEGTFAPLQEVLAADVDDPSEGDLGEVLNYVRAADHAFAWLDDGRPLTVGLLTDLQGRLVRGTAADTDQAGRVRTIQVLIGADPGALVKDARFVPGPPGPELEHRLRDVIDWMATDHDGEFDPVVAAAMAHYQFETLHPFNDGNGRIGRLLVVLHLVASGTLVEPTLTVSPWFETRRGEYYDRLLDVSARGGWDGWIRFFADGLAASASDTRRSLLDLLDVQSTLKDRVRQMGLRAETAIQLVDYSLAQPIFTVRQVERHLGVTYPRANTLVQQLVEAGVLRQNSEKTNPREFTAPDVLAVLLR